MEFARLWMESRRRRRPRGKYAIAAELTQKGISADIIAAVLAQFDEEAAARAAALPKIRQWRKLDNAEVFRKTFFFLRRKGFPYELCRQITQELTTDLQSA